MDQILKSEIEVAASESRKLADDLAGMLARLEIEEDRNQAVNAAVIGEEAEVEEALKEMVEKIEKLAEASEDTSTDTVNGLVKKKRVKEQELRKTLEQLEVVASQIEEAAGSADSAEDVNSIEKIAKLLQSISDKVERKNNDESGNKERVRSQFTKTQSKTGLELNGIAEMIKSLEKVTKDLKGEDNDEDEDEGEETENDKSSLDSTVSRLLAVVDQDDNDVSKLGIDGATSRRVAKLLDDVKRGGRRGEQKSRSGKQLDLNEVFEEDAENFDLDNDEDEEEENAKEENRKGKENSSIGGTNSYNKQQPEEDVVTCKSKVAEDKVRICLPEAKTSRSPVRLPSARLEEHSACLDLGRTVCNESSAVLSREVCMYEYQQTDVLAPAQTVDLTFQPRVEKIGVTRCHVETEKHGYKQVEVEKCVLEYIDAAYILPEMAINVDEFMKLQLPEPEKRCTVFQYELPEVVCGEHLRHHCIQVSHLKPHQVTEYADAATLAYGGSCQSRTLSQEQEICTTEKKVSHSPHRRPRYQRY